MRQVLRGSRAGTWGPLLIGVYSMGMIGAGIFYPDPVPGFPPGTPASAMSGRGLIHLSVATRGFLALITACFIWARRFAAKQRWGWVAYSVVSGVIFFLAFAGEASGQLYLNPAFVFTALNAFIWVSVMAALLLTGRG